MEWATPQDFFNRLDHVYEFQLDASASAKNAKCARFFSKKDDGLSQDWYPFRRVWLNPPYGRGIEHWMRKAWEESLKGCLVVCLVPARTDTKWWQSWVTDKAQVTFVPGRLKYVNTRQNKVGSAPFPSALVIYGSFPAEVSGSVAAVPDAPRSRG